MEIWKQYNDYFEVSNKGNVRKYDFVYYHTNRWGAIQKKTMNGGIIEPYDDGKGYLRFYSQGKRYYVHKLVAELFIPNPDNLPVVNHRDENTQNNVVENLEWCTKEYNDKYGTARERAVNKMKKKVYQYTLDNELVRIWESVKECKENGFSESCISLCCNGKLKTHKGYKWSYKPL